MTLEAYHLYPLVMNSPADPISAVTYPDPYPFYADLVDHRPLYRDEALRFWVASSAQAVTSVLTSDLCRVRPPSEPVPPALLGSPTGEIFRHLVRMNDGPGHCPLKQGVAAALDRLDAARIAEESRRWARGLDSQDLADFAFRLPVTVVASLLGVPEQSLDQTVRWVRSFVPALAPGCAPDVLAEGTAAAGHLLDFFRSLGDDGNVMIANRIGLMFQAHDATAGLIGNTLVALATHREAYDQVTADSNLLANAVLETLRFDPPVQNTRRFVARDGIVAGQAMQEGDAILVVLAAANRDPAIHAKPDRFDLFRENRKHFTFGTGIHACPGERLATSIAQAGIEQVLRGGFDLARFAAARTYRPSVNGRIPFAS